MTRVAPVRVCGVLLAQEPPSLVRTHIKMLITRCASSHACGKTTQPGLHAVAFDTMGRAGGSATKLGSFHN